MEFKSSIYIDFKELKFTTHSDGAVSFNLESLKKKVHVSAHIKCAEGIVALMQLLDHLQTKKHKVKTLTLPYVPFGRQDRITGNEEVTTPFMLKAFCKMLNSFKNIESVLIVDPHSNVFETLVDNTNVLSQAETFESTYFVTDGSKYDFVVAPDQGAYKKSKAIAEKLKVPLLVVDKVRDPITSDLKVVLKTDADLTNKRILICDDIIDYGGSVIEVSKQLREQYNASQINVYATHAILPTNQRVTPPSRFTTLCEAVDDVYCYYLWKSEHSPSVHPNVHELNSF